MANLVLGVGTSHTPLIILSDDLWERRAADDRQNPSLNTRDGRYCSYAELVAERGEPYAEECSPARFAELASEAEAALDWLAQAIAKADPEVVMVVGDDQDELFQPGNQPAIAVFYGDEFIMKPGESAASAPGWLLKHYGGYWMDLPHRRPCHPDLAVHLIRGLMAEGVDVAAMNRIANPVVSGFGHAFGFVIQRLLRNSTSPIVPVVLNTYFAPNQPTAGRCLDIGTKMNRVLRSLPSDLRICVIASGGLSHFICEEEFDRQLLDALEAHDEASLRAIPQQTLISGTSEIRNWILVSGMLPEAAFKYRYIPVRRTPVGTGIGMCFAVWNP